jgi:hypothetical protein
MTPASKNAPSIFMMDGISVEFHQVPIFRHDWGHTEDKAGNLVGHPMERRRFRILADGAFIGWLTQPHGFGKQPFRITRAGRDGYIDHGVGYPEVWGFNESRSLWLWELEAAAAKVAELRKETRSGNLPRLPTEDELRTHVRECREEDRREEAAARQRIANWEAEERAEEERAEAERMAIVEGLSSIDNRLAGALTNHEINALRAAIASFSPSPADGEDTDNPFPAT